MRLSAFLILIAGLILFFQWESPIASLSGKEDRTGDSLVSAVNRQKAKVRAQEGMNHEKKRSDEALDESIELSAKESLRKFGTDRLMLMAFHDRPEKFIKRLSQVKEKDPQGFLETLSSLRDKDGASLLHWAVMGRCISCLDYLLETGLSVDLANNRGETALVFSLGHGDIELTKKLLAHGADPNVEFNNINYTLLMDASFEGNLELVSSLVEAGARLKEQDAKGFSALHYAAKEGHLEAVKVLLRGGASKNSLDKFGKRPKDYARQYGFRNIVNLL